MLNDLLFIAQFILDAFRQTWPYLLVTIPLAVIVQMTGASRYIRRAFQARPVTAILLATLVGAFSPFCSCSVIPLIASLLIGGVPLAPVMSFWIASPSMDPEVFFLSVAMLGWELAVWRLLATLLLSLSAGFITHFVVQKGWLGANILRTHRPPRVLRSLDLLRSGWRLAKARFLTPAANNLAFTPLSFAPAGACCPDQPAKISAPDPALQVALLPGSAAACTTECSSGLAVPAQPAPQITSTRQRLLSEAGKALLLVAQFMALAYFLEAVIQLYVPEAWIAGVLGRQNPWAIPTAALLGVPVYTGNLTALPLVSGLLSQGMNPAAALAFLIAGPITTLPAMSAVWGLVSRRVFALYVAFALFGAMVLGYLYQVASLLVK